MEMHQLMMIEYYRILKYYSFYNKINEINKFCQKYQKKLSSSSSHTADSYRVRSNLTFYYPAAGCA